MAGFASEASLDVVRDFFFQFTVMTVVGAVIRSAVRWGWMCVSLVCFCEQGADTDAPPSGTLELQLHGAPRRLHGEAGVHDLPGERV